MDSKFIPTFLSVLAFVFIMYALIFMSPIEKIDSGCAPVTVWPGKLIEAGLRVNNPSTADKFARSVDSGFNSCRKWLWNAFYDDRYQQLKRVGAVGEAAPVIAKSPAPAPAHPGKPKAKPAAPSTEGAAGGDGVVVQASPGESEK